MRVWETRQKAYCGCNSGGGNALDREGVSNKWVAYRKSRESGREEGDNRERENVR